MIDDCGSPAIHVHNYPADGRMEQALKLLRQILRGQQTMSDSFSDVTAAITGLEGRVQGISDVTQSAVETLTELAALVRDVQTQLDTAGTEEERRAAAARLAALGDTLDTRKQALATAIANTDPTPGPGPTPPEPVPTPEPVAPDNGEQTPPPPNA